MCFLYTTPSCLHWKESMRWTEPQWRHPEVNVWSSVGTEGTETRECVILTSASGHPQHLLVSSLCRNRVNVGCIWCQPSVPVQAVSVGRSRSPASFHAGGWWSCASCPHASNVTFKKICHFIKVFTTDGHLHTVITHVKVCKMTTFQPSFFL